MAIVVFNLKCSAWLLFFTFAIGVSTRGFVIGRRERCGSRCILRMRRERLDIKRSPRLQVFRTQARIPQAEASWSRHSRPSSSAEAAPAATWHDLRERIAAIERSGEFKRIRELMNADKEVSAITARG